MDPFCNTLNLQKQDEEEVHIPDEEVQERALQIAERLDIKGFEASKAWLARFKVQVGFRV